MGSRKNSAGAILVNTAYTADRASYADSSGYASSAGSAPGGMRPSWGGWVSLGRNRGGWAAPANGYLYVRTYTYNKRIGDSWELIWSVGTVQFASAILTIGGLTENIYGSNSAADSMLIPVATGNGGSIIGVDAWFLPCY